MSSLRTIVVPRFFVGSSALFSWHQVEKVHASAIRIGASWEEQYDVRHSKVGHLSRAIAVYNVTYAFSALLHDHPSAKMETLQPRH
jgi:hypothetical protein